MNETPEAIVQRQVDAYNAHDIEAFVATYAADAAYIEHATNQVLFAGHNAIHERYGNLFVQHPRVNVEIKDRMTFGQYVIDYEEITGRQNVDVGHVVCIYQVKDNLIQRAWVLRG